jgi:hypothetical protein
VIVGVEIGDPRILDVRAAPPAVAEAVSVRLHTVTVSTA